MNLFAQGVRLLKGPKWLAMWSSVRFCYDEKIFGLHYSTISVQRLQKGVTGIVATMSVSPPPPFYASCGLHL